MSTRDSVWRRSWPGPPVYHAGGIELGSAAVVLQGLPVGARGQVRAEDDADQGARYAAQLRHLPVPPGAQQASGVFFV